MTDSATDNENHIETMNRIKNRISFDYNFKDYNFKLHFIGCAE